MSVVVRTLNPDGGVAVIQSALGGAAASAAEATAVVVVGDVIDVPEQDGFLRGHGTHVVGGQLVATTCGVVQRVNKLVYVKPLKSRYVAEQGDVIVGRVSEISGKRWKVDLRSRQEAALLLSAVDLPGGVQRRRNAEDELNMRSFFREGDLVSAEVQQVNSDGGVMLHTRSNKYGKLEGGQLLAVPANLVKRQKQHFVSEQAFGVDLILGCNGLIWVAPSSSGAAPPQQPPQQSAPGLGLRYTRQQIESVTRAANAVRALAALYLPIYPAAIREVYTSAVEEGIPLKDMLEGDFLTTVLQKEAESRRNTVAQVAG